MILGTYIAIGIIWGVWLEYFTTRHLDEYRTEGWNNRERVFHLVLWPYSLGVFLKSAVSSMFKDK